MKAKTLKASSAWDAMTEAFAFLNRKHCVLETSDGLTRYNGTERHCEVKKVYRCTRCEAEFYLAQDLRYVSNPKFLVKPGAHALRGACGETVRGYVLECETPRAWRDFKRIACERPDWYGRLDADNGVWIPPADETRFRELLASCYGRIVSEVNQ